MLQREGRKTAFNANDKDRRPDPARSPNTAKGKRVSKRKPARPNRHKYKAGLYKERTEGPID